MTSADKLREAKLPEATLALTAALNLNDDPVERIALALAFEMYGDDPDPRSYMDAGDIRDEELAQEQEHREKSIRYARVALNALLDPAPGHTTTTRP